MSIPSQPNDPVTTARVLLRARLTAAMKARDRVAAGALRSVLGAIDNAEAVESTSTPTATTSEYVAAAAVGVGVTEAERRSLTGPEVRAIVEQEVADRRAAIPSFAGGGPRAAERAGELEAEIDVLASLLDELPA